MNWSQAPGPQVPNEIPRANHKKGILVALGVALPFGLVGLLAPSADPISIAGNAETPRQVVAITSASPSMSTPTPVRTPTRTPQPTTATPTPSPAQAEQPTNPVPHVEPEPEPAPPVEPEPAPPVEPEPEPAPPVEAEPAPVNVYYANCTEARAAGAAPILVGEPGYRSALDRDNDGVACE